jgi:methylmalonyl-CoA/ethylmalonyl-CoA epimerase
VTTPFRELHHICIVVRDIDASVAWYESVGIGPWQDYPPLTEYTRLSVPSPDAFRALKYKVANLDNLDVLARGQRDNGSGFIYFDTYDRAGVVLLARQTAR